MLRMQGELNKGRVTTEFAYDGTSRGLHKERYCRMDIISELKCI